MAKINDISELREDLLIVYNDLRNGKIGIREARENANMAGKIIASAKIQLEYNAYMKASKKISFLEA